ncbi:MAG: CYTH domain-containing protein [Clostridia bacterium]|nr:CYTH domain-containing protein [Clostridia bacterium]
MAYEIERKFLIEYPNLNELEAYPNYTKSEIAQTYLMTDDGFTSRVRKRTTNGATKYIFTEKKRVNDLKCIENEHEITKEEYNGLLRLADPERITVEKTRYCLPCGGRVVEIDIYPFWTDRAIAEVEMEDENEKVELPDFIKVIRDVTAEKAYKNYSLAKEIPSDC